MSAKRKAGIPRYPLRIDIDPQSWDWLWKISRTRDEGMGLTLEDEDAFLRSAPIDEVRKYLEAKFPQGLR